MGWCFLYWQRIVSWDTARSAEGATTFLQFLQCVGFTFTVVWWSSEFSAMMSKEVAFRGSV